MFNIHLCNIRIDTQPHHKDDDDDDVYRHHT